MMSLGLTFESARRTVISMAGMIRGRIASPPSTDGGQLPYTVTEHAGIRRVTQRATRADGSTHEIVSEHLVGLTRWYVPAGRNEPIPLYEGAFTVGNRGYGGSIWFGWAPRPSIKMAGVAADPLPTKDEVLQFLDSGSPRWIPPAPFALPDPKVTPPNLLRCAGGLPPGTTQPCMAHVMSFGSAPTAVSSASPSSSRTVGRRLMASKSEAQDPLHVVNGGILARNGEWEVLIHPRLDGDVTLRQRDLGAHGGFDITHVGQIRRLDGATFTTNRRSR